uniref:Uncharacterized protein n=1 Tax=Arundo donax TaxID=35708 RepID=A0A0A9E9W9_ARUDO
MCHCNHQSCSFYGIPVIISLHLCFYLLSVNTGPFAKHSWFIIIVGLELLSKQLILVL